MSRKKSTGQTGQSHKQKCRSEHAHGDGPYYPPIHYLGLMKFRRYFPNTVSYKTTTNHR